MQVVPRVLRDVAIMSQVTAVLTLLDSAGHSILYQNAQSMKYMGLLAGRHPATAAPGTPRVWSRGATGNGAASCHASHAMLSPAGAGAGDGMGATMLQALFVFEPQQLHDMLACVQSGRPWRKMIRVPACIKQCMRLLQQQHQQSQHSQQNHQQDQQEHHRKQQLLGLSKGAGSHKSTAELGGSLAAAARKAGRLQALQQDVELLLLSNSFSLCKKRGSSSTSLPAGWLLEAPSSSDVGSHGWGFNLTSATGGHVGPACPAAATMAAPAAAAEVAARAACTVPCDPQVMYSTPSAVATHGTDQSTAATAPDAAMASDTAAVAPAKASAAPASATHVAATASYRRVAEALSRAMQQQPATASTAATATAEVDDALQSSAWRVAQIRPASIQR